MPARDGTGPKGQGARTGRGLGNCQPNEQYLPSDRRGVWWNPLGWFRGIFRTDTRIGRGTRQGIGRGGRGRR